MSLLSVLLLIVAAFALGLIIGFLGSNFLIRTFDAGHEPDGMWQ